MVLALVYIEIFFLVINPFSLSLSLSLSLFLVHFKANWKYLNTSPNTSECNQSSVFAYRFSSYEVKPTAVKHINCKCMFIAFWQIHIPRQVK